MGGGGGIIGSIISSVFSTVLSSALAPSAPSAPAPAPAPPPPAVEPVPEAPEPANVSELGADAQVAVVDTEAAKSRAVKRRRAANQKTLFGLSSESDTENVSKSLLGE